ncbi:MAG: hypothetical protein ACTHMS_05560, partial [Jatrophihabitans sp.]
MPEPTLAEQLLDAQVAWIVDQLTGADAAANLARDVDDLLDFAGSAPISELLDPADVKDIARHVVDLVGATALADETVGAVADAVYDLDASGEYQLGAVIDRDPVDALIVKA